MFGRHEIDITVCQGCGTTLTRQETEERVYIHCKGCGLTHDFPNFVPSFKEMYENLLKRINTNNNKTV